jgi:hypothetical protein
MISLLVYFLKSFSVIFFTFLTVKIFFSTTLGKKFKLFLILKVKFKKNIKIAIVKRKLTQIKKYFIQENFHLLLLDEDKKGFIFLQD